MHRPQLLHLTLLCSAALAVATPALAQAPLTNASLKGAYNVRYLGVIGMPSDFPISFSGTFTFDGNGNFTASGSGVYFNGSSSLPAPLAATGGMYSVQPSGQVALSNPFSQGNASLYGGVGINGTFVASSTESSYLDLIVGIPQGSALSNATLTGTYRVAGLEFAGGSINAMRAVSFNATADGSGSLGNLSLSGSSSALNDSSNSQTSSGATYTVTANGTGTLTIPAPSGVSTANQLIAGAKTLYVSPDGSFFVAGSPTGWDMQIGVKAITSGGSTIFSGLYYSAAVENAPSFGVDSWYGSSNEVPSSQAELFHERFNDSESGFPAYDYMSSDSFVPNADGTSVGSGYYFAVGANGNYAIQVTGTGDYSLEVWVRIPSFSGSGVFINPTGVVNVATNTPFTAQLSPGEFINLYGTGFISGQPQQATKLPFPTQLGGVQVMVNGSAIPIQYVSANQISAVIPYTAPSDGSLVNIQVVSNGAQSNTVQEYTGLTSPGVFTVPSGGLGDGAILHADNSLINTSNPAKAGETVQMFVAGLGAVTDSTIAAGSAAPSMSQVSNQVFIFIDDVNGNYTQAKVTYAGLAPGFGGLYQVNFTIPTGLSLNATGATEMFVEVSTTDADTIQATIPISH